MRATLSPREKGEGGRGNIVAMFLGERITNNARKILVVGTQGLEPRAGIVYKTIALTN